MSQQVAEKKEVEKEDVVIPSSEMSAGKREALEVAEEAREKKYRLPSFGAKLFTGDFDPSLLFPFPRQSEEDKRIGDEFIEKLEVVLKEQLDPDEVDRTGELPKGFISTLAKLGIFALKIPKEYGGLGFSQTNYGRIVQKIASYCGSTATLVSAHQSIGVPQPLLLYGTEEQKKKFFPLFRKGAISAFALTEMDVGSDPAQMSATAKLSQDGSHYILNGEKLWCTNGNIADIIIVLALTDPKIVKGKEKKQITAFILEMNTPGVEVTHRCEFMGLKGIYNGVLHFKDVKIPKENLLWEEGRGLAMALATINVGRLTLPGACAGGGKQCLYIARRWGSERVQWGSPVGEHEEGRQKIAYIAATTFAMEAVMYLTSAWADEKNVDLRIEAAMAKLFCTEELWKLCDMTLQFRGGRGFETGRSLKARGEEPLNIERGLRDCRVNRIFEGSTEIMKLFLAREAMDPHLKEAAPLLQKNLSLWSKIGLGLKFFGRYSAWYCKQLFRSLIPGSHPELGPLRKEFEFIDKQSHRLACRLFFSMVKYQQRLEKRQMLLGHLMEIGTELFAMAATCSYAQSLNKENPQDKSPIELARYFCSLSRRRIGNHFRALKDNDDKEGNKIAKKVLDREYTWLEKGIIKAGYQKD